MQAAQGLASQGQHGGSVEKIVADALHGGAAGPSIDALLQAFADGGHGAHAGLATMASAAAGAVPAWDNADVAAMLAAQHMNVVANALVLHHDAIQPTAQG